MASHDINSQTTQALNIPLLQANKVQTFVPVTP
jgi:hypothetical protein